VTLAPSLPSLSGLFHAGPAVKPALRVAGSPNPPLTIFATIFPLMNL
jgi:hypothetical protein